MDTRRKSIKIPRKSMTKRQGFLDFISNRIHRVHSHFKHLTVCGAGVKNSIIGNTSKAKIPCRMCETGAKI